MKLFLTITLGLGLAFGIANIAATNPIAANCSWEGYECDGCTVLGVVGTGDPAIIAENVEVPAQAGARCVSLRNNSPSGAPRAIVAFVQGLEPGDEVTAFCEATGVCSIRGHWSSSLPGDPYSIAADAGGSAIYENMLSHTWTVPVSYGGLVIKVVVEGEPGDTVLVDELYVHNSGGQPIQLTTPCGTVVGSNETSWGWIKAEYR